MIFINSSDVVIHWYDYTSGYQTVNLSIVCLFTTLSMLFGFVFYFNLLWESRIIILCLNAGTAIRWFTNCSPDTELKSLCQFTICNVPFNLDHMTNYHCKPHDNCTVCHIIPNTQGHVSLRVPLCGKTPNMDWNVIIGVKVNLIVGKVLMVSNDHAISIYHLHSTGTVVNPSPPNTTYQMVSARKT